MLEREISRASNAVFDAVNTTAMHLRRIVGLVSSVVTRTAREVEHLVWDYQDIADDMRRAHSGDGVDNVIPFDARRRATRYRNAPTSRDRLSDADFTDLRQQLNPSARTPGNS